MAKKYYVVWKGRSTGIFGDWTSTQKSILKFPGAQFKSYPTRQEAEDAFASGTNLSNSQTKSSNLRNTDNIKTSSKSNQTQFDVQIYCDGGCEPNPGKAASGIAVYRNSKISELWYGLYNPKGTNNTAELNALHQSLLLAQKELKSGKTVEILCDSMYSINCITNWALSWKKNGWKKKTGEIKNLKIIQIAHELYLELTPQIKMSHIKAHAGFEGNELADRMTMYGILQKNKNMVLYDQTIDVVKLLKMRAG